MFVRYVYTISARLHGFSIRVYTELTFAAHTFNICTIIPIDNLTVLSMCMRINVSKVHGIHLQLDNSFPIRSVPCA
jgi:hypothetical protein